VVIMSTWIVVGHRAGARIVEHTRSGLKLIEEIDHAAGRLKDNEIESDRPGRAFSSVGTGRSAYSPHETAHDHAAQTFASQLAQTLRAARNEHRFDRLVLVAEPRFLGMMRGALDGATAALIHDEAHKDLANVPMHDLHSHLREVSFL
jgi:protein required for attachment to host cells